MANFNPKFQIKVLNSNKLASQAIDINQEYITDFKVEHITKENQLFVPKIINKTYYGFGYLC